MPKPSTPLRFVCDKCNTSLAAPILPPGGKLEGPCPRCGNHLVFSGPELPQPVTPPPSQPAAAAAPRNHAAELYGPPKSTPAGAKPNIHLMTLKNVKAVELISVTAIVVLTLAIAWAAWTKFRPVPPARVISSTQPA